MGFEICRGLATGINCEPYFIVDSPVRCATRWREDKQATINLLRSSTFPQLHLLPAATIHLLNYLFAPPFKTVHLTLHLRRCPYFFACRARCAPKGVTSGYMYMRVATSEQCCSIQPSHLYSLALCIDVRSNLMIYSILPYYWRGKLSTGISWS